MGLMDFLDPGNFLNPSKNNPATSQYMGSQFANLNNFQLSPEITGLESMVGSMKSPTAVSSGGPAYQAKDMSKVDLPQYDAMRTRLNSQYSKTQSQGQDSIDRQFAASGGGPGNGAQAKQTENLTAATEAQKGQDLEGVNAQEAQTRTQLQQTQDAQAFQSGESAMNRNLQANEFNTGQQTQFQQFQEQAGAGVAGLGLQDQQAQAEANNNEFNKALSQWQAKHTGGLLGGGGFLGLGIGG